MLRALWNRWLMITQKIGYVQSQLILAFMYFVVLAPFALAVKLFMGPLRLRSAPSWHWVPRDSQPAPTLDSIRQQF